MSGDYLQAQYAYAHDVLSGAVPACVWTRLAAQRSVDDLARMGDPDWPYYFDDRKAEKFRRFCLSLKHLEGPLGGTSFVLEPWQLWAVGQALGWLKKSGPAANKRRFRILYLEVPRGNGKSFLMTALALFMLTLDGEYGPQVYSAAVDSDQARVVYNKAVDHIRDERNAALMNHLSLHSTNNQITVKRGKLGTFKPLSSNTKSGDGKNVYCAIFDELHAIRDRKMWDLLRSGMNKRLQSLMVAITTAGKDMTSFGYEQNNYLKTILQGALPEQDEATFGAIWSIDEGDDPYDERTWIKANPCWHTAIDHDSFRAQASKAKFIASERPEFFTKQLNQWLSGSSRWLDIDALKKGYDPTLKPTDSHIATLPCFIGTDLSTRNDMTAIVAVYYEQVHQGYKFYVFPKYYLPETALHDEKNNHYRQWNDAGYLTIHQGVNVTLNDVQEDVIQLSTSTGAREICADRYESRQMIQAVQSAGYQCVEIPQTASALSEAAKEFELSVLRGDVHYNNPIFTWNCANTFITVDTNENIKPKKENTNASAAKIDGLAATINAITRILYHGSNDVGPMLYF